MPATERAFSAPLPSRLYVDTDIIVAYLVASEPHHARCRAFLERLAQHSAIRLFVSSLSWMEFVNVITRERFRQVLPDHVRTRFAVDRWHIASVRRTYVRFFLDAFEDLLNQFAWAEISVTRQVRTLAADIATTYNLRSYDAVHIASARFVQAVDIASLDDAFRRINGLILRNDRIHTSTR